MTRISNPDWLPRVMEKEMFSHHSIYKYFRHNHVPHMIGALARLGASEAHVQAYLDEANKYLPAYNKGEELIEPVTVDSLKSNNLLDYRGENVGFYAMKEKYEELMKTKYDGDILKMVKDVCPDIIDGPLGGAFHGIITMAYGLIGKSNGAILEGLLFMDQQYTPMLPVEHPKNKDLSRFGKGQTDIMDVLRKLHDDREQMELEKKQREEDDKKSGLHAKALYGWTTARYHGEKILDLTDSIKLPSWFDASNEDMDQIFRLIDWFFDMATYVYVKSENLNDFFLLHGITSSWCTTQVLPLFDFKTALLAFRGLVSSVLATYLVQGAPELSRQPEDHFSGEVTEEAWKTFINTTLEEIMTGTKYEFHVYKVIQVCYEAWVTRPDSGYAKYYFAAAHAVKKTAYCMGGGVTFSQNDISQ